MTAPEIEALAVALVRASGSADILPQDTDAAVLGRFGDQCIPLAEAFAAVIRAEVRRAMPPNP